MMRLRRVLTGLLAGAAFGAVASAQSGVCCFPAVPLCQVTDQAVCENFSGTFLPGEDCSGGNPCQLGACCQTNDTGSSLCFADQTEADCIDPNNFDGVFTAGGDCFSLFVCPGETGGACCSASGCFELTQSACESPSAMGGFDGVFLEGQVCEDITCPAFGACCIPSPDTCTATTESACAAITGATYYGDESSCSPITGGCPRAACCGDFPCEPATEFACLTESRFAGGAWGGIGSSCHAGCVVVSDADGDGSVVTAELNAALGSLGGGELTFDTASPVAFAGVPLPAISPVDAFDYAALFVFVSGSP